MDITAVVGMKSFIGITQEQKLVQVIQTFHRKWKADEVLDELKRNYPSLSKLTRMMAKNETPLNLVRADFTSLKQDYDEDRQNFPKLGPSTYARPYIPLFGKYPQQGYQPIQQERQNSLAKTKYEANSTGNILQTFTDKMDGRLQQLQSTITEQLCDIEVKIDKQQR
ncbi:unnamed protein product [Didymodactylos carnosus]|uniref:Uncharacterized protein n=1 Tax=Didymodactylos carnosus TaxID=1234261 RepID=A0A814VGQ9_9BILA|nr:unnamed protein product [Didymodactylos carnosus]CAF3953033.1 unnamed protein product [Didymodactylos carnosus]